MRTGVQHKPSAMNTHILVSGHLRSLAASQMTLTTASLQRFQLPLKRPLTTEAAANLHRHGILLRVHGRLGAQDCVGIGEASPLPGTLRCRCKILLHKSGFPRTFTRTPTVAVRSCQIQVRDFMDPAAILWQRLLRFERLT